MSGSQEFDGACHSEEADGDEDSGKGIKVGAYEEADPAEELFEGPAPRERRRAAARASAEGYPGDDGEDLKESELSSADAPGAGSSQAVAAAGPVDDQAQEGGGGSSDPGEEVWHNCDRA